MKSLTALKPDVFFLTYDEPLKDLYWEKLKALIPWAKRIDGVKGFDAAHKACAGASTSRRLFVIDGDNSVDPGFLHLKLPSRLAFSKAVFSWAGRNSVNGLVYGNGGIKNWSVSTLKNMRSHETAPGEKMALDFHFGVTYRQQSGSFSTADIHQTPFQAFRSGFREGIKMSLFEGEKVKESRRLPELLPRSNFERLKIWCSIGADVPNGLWAIYGARMACRRLLEPQWDHRIIHDYDWFAKLWEDQIAPCFSGFQNFCPHSRYHWSAHRLQQAIEEEGEILSREASLILPLFSPEKSAFFKSVYVNRPRQPVLREWN
jgi:hypothetical protein